MKLYELSLKQFLDETGAKQVLPSGGSSAALNAAMATALTEMVANLTIGKKSYVDVEDRMRKIVQIMSESRVYFTEVINKDAETFSQALKAFGLPKSTEKERQYRDTQIQESMKKATLLPLELAEKAFNLFDIIVETLQKGNKKAVADGVMGLLNCRTAIIGSVINVRVNTKIISNKAFVKEMEERCNLIEQQLNTKEAEATKWIKTILKTKN